MQGGLHQGRQRVRNKLQQRAFTAITAAAAGALAAAEAYHT